MHPAQAVVSHSSQQPHHHHFEEERRPPPYNPNDYSTKEAPPQQLGFEPMAPMGFQQPYVQQPTEPSYQHYPQPPAGPINSVVITNQPYSMSTHNLTSLKGLPHHATTVTCSNCQGVVSTRVDHSANCKTHCWACCLFLFLCWPCVCVPYCSDSCQTTSHYCTRCDSYLGNSHNL